MQSPQVPDRAYSVESVVGPRHITAGGCGAAHGGLRGGPLITDRWSSWMQEMHGRCMGDAWEMHERCMGDA